ncbi:MAG: phosphatidate cytidylyltransferase [Spongiibacteraceae bacterium]
MLKQRVITGLILAVVVATAIFVLPLTWFAGFVGLVLVAALWEWADLAGIGCRPLRAIYCVVGIALMWLIGWGATVWTLPRERVVGEVLLLAAGWWVLAAVLVITYPRSNALWSRAWQRILMGWLTLVPAGLAFVFLRAQAHGEWLLLFTVALVAAADIGAYFAGTRFGRHKLAPHVSPGKSWEGFAGGLAASLLLVVIVWALVWRERFDLPALLAVAAVTVLGSVCGDLLESMLKRQRGVKDSSNLLPGHGGVLDRLDSLSAAVPIFALGLLLMAA